jgi:DNA-binding response OmpR family regulator
MKGMATNPTLLCIHRDPAQLRVLEENGYQLLTAANGSEGLRLFGSRPVDGIVLEHELGLLDGTVVAAEIKKIKPQLPIVMLVDNLELPDGTLKFVDAFVTRSDGAHFLWATVHFVLNVKRERLQQKNLQTKTRAPRGRPGRLRIVAKPSQLDTLQASGDDQGEPFSPRVWRGIRSGSFQF